MAERVVLQKLLHTEMAKAIVDDGYDQVGGYVVDAAAAAELRTPEAILHAYGYDQAPEFLDVVRFEVPPLAKLSKPEDSGERSWPTYPLGFLRGDAIVPVWVLERTRFPYGAEYWRIRSDGEQKCLSAYVGCARGWRGAQGWRPPSKFVGPLARWRDQEYFADVVGDGALLTAFGESPGELAEAEAREIRPEVWAGAVSLDDCELFELLTFATARGERVRVIDSGPWGARVLLQTDDEDRAARFGAEASDQGVFEAIVPVAELEDSEAFTRTLAPDSA